MLRAVGSNCKVPTRARAPHKRKYKYNPCRSAGHLQTSWFQTASLPCSDLLIRLYKATLSSRESHRSVRLPHLIPITNVIPPRLNMTSRSHKEKPYPEIATFSRRLRTRADQNTSVQPPEIPQLRSVRPRRKATLPASRHVPIDTQFVESSQSPTREKEEVEEQSHLEYFLNATGVVERQPLENSAQVLNLNSYHTALSSQLGLASANKLHGVHHHEDRQGSVSELPPSPLPSVSGSIDFRLQLPADSQQPPDSFTDFQDMR